MKKKYSVPLGILLLISITYLCVAYIPSTEAKGVDHLEPGRYELIAKGDIDLNLAGTAVFGMEQSISNNGAINERLELQLKNPLSTGGHYITIYVSDREFSRSLKKGTYLITENIEGFINQFEGVFGFADIEPLGELPYFARKGEITIIKADNNSIAGRLMMILRNASGDIVELEGDFLASLEEAD